MSFWDVMKTSASGLSAQRLRLDVISNNIANAETTRTEDGGPYQRQDVVFTAQEEKSFLPQFLRARQTGENNLSSNQGGVKVSSIITDDSPGTTVYDPEHPDANEEGYVEFPNVNMVVEMTNMLSATRSYEANLTVIEAAKRMALKALEIAR